MGDTHQALGVIYEARRQSRGPTKPAPKRNWKKRIILAGVTFLILAAAVTFLYIRWSMRRVNTVQARVWASVINVSPDNNGVMLELLASPGEKAQKGEVLARLDDSQAKASLEAAEAELRIRRSLFEQANANQELTRSRVEAEIEQAQFDVRIARGRANATLAELELRRSRLPAEIIRAEAQRDIAKVALYGLQNGARKEQIEAAKVRLDTERALLELYRAELEWSEQLLERKIESEYTIQITQTKVNNQANRVREMELQLAELEAGARPDQIEAAAHELTAREAALNIVKTTDQELKALETELEILEAEVERAESELKRAETLALEIERAEQNKNIAEAELQKAIAEKNSRQMALENLSIKSPVDGTVIRSYRKPGELCRNGEPIFMIAESQNGRWIECYVRSHDALRVMPGQEARVRLLAGIGNYVTAEVKSVGIYAQTLADETETPGMTPQAGSELVRVVLQPTEELGPNLLGMSAKAVIFTD